MITRCVGMNGNNGFQLQLNLCGFFDANSAISSMVLAPLAVSMIDHFWLISHHSDVGHLHQM